MQMLSHTCILPVTVFAEFPPMGIFTITVPLNIPKEEGQCTARS